MLDKTPWDKPFRFGTSYAPSPLKYIVKHKYHGVNKIRSNKLEKIKSEIGSLYDEDKLTRQNIVDFGKWKGNENAIFFQITGKTVDDISHLEDYLLANFRLFSVEYDLERIKLGRKKFLNMNYVLFHLLKQLGHKVDPNNFPKIKTEKTKKKYDEIPENDFFEIGMGILGLKKHF